MINMFSRSQRVSVWVERVEHLLPVAYAIIFRNSMRLM